MNTLIFQETATSMPEFFWMLNFNVDKKNEQSINGYVEKVLLNLLSSYSEVKLWIIDKLAKNSSYLHLFLQSN